MDEKRDPSIPLLYGKGIAMPTSSSIEITLSTDFCSADGNAPYQAANSSVVMTSVAMNAA